MDWNVFFSNEKSLKVIRRAVFRSIPADQDLAAEAFSFVVEEILKDDQRRLQSYRPGTDPDFFLYFVARRIMRDFWISKKGRFRCPQSLLRQKKAGFLKVLIYKMLCWQQLPKDFIIERLKDAGRVEEEVKGLMWEIREEFPDCGKPEFSEISLDETLDSSPEQFSVLSSLRPETALESLPERVALKDLRYLFDYILRVVPVEIPEDRIISAKTRRQLKKARRKFKANDEECRFFRLIHLMEMSVSAAGRMLGWRKDVAHGKSRRLWEKFCRAVPMDLLTEFDPDVENRSASLLHEANNDPA